VQRRDQDKGDEYQREPVDALEIYEHLRDIKDPEHPHTLEELNVLEHRNIYVDDKAGVVRYVSSSSRCTQLRLGKVIEFELRG